MSELLERPITFEEKFNDLFKRDMLPDEVALVERIDKNIKDLPTATAYYGLSVLEAQRWKSIKDEKKGLLINIFGDITELPSVEKIEEQLRKGSLPETMYNQIRTQRLTEVTMFTLTERFAVAEAYGNNNKQ